MQIYLIFDLENVSDKYSLWDQDQIGIKLGTDFIIYQELENFMYKRISMLTGLKVASMPCKCVFYRTNQNAKGGLNFEGL